MTTFVALIFLMLGCSTRSKHSEHLPSRKCGTGNAWLAFGLATAAGLHSYKGDSRGDNLPRLDHIEETEDLKNCPNHFER